MSEEDRTKLDLITSRNLEILDEIYMLLFTMSIGTDRVKRATDELGKVEKRMEKRVAHPTPIME